MANGYVVDATVLIDHLRGNERATAYLSPLLSRGLLVLHPAVQAEVLIGARNRRHLSLLDEALAEMRRCSIKDADMIKAVDLVRAHTLTCGVDWPDCLIAATCMRLRLPLVTLNDKHFKPIRGLGVIRRY